MGLRISGTGRRNSSSLTAGKLIFGLVAALVATVWVCVLRDFHSQYEIWRETAQLMESNVTADHLLESGRSLIFERGRVIVRLAADAPLDASTRDFIDQRRREGDAAFAAAIAGLSQDAASTLRAARDHLDELRLRADRELALPLDARDPEFRRRWAYDTTRILGGLSETVRGSILRAGRFPSGFRLLTRVKLGALALRETLGEETSRLGAAAVVGRTLPMPELVELARLRSRADAVWSSIRTETILAGNARLTNAVDAAQMVLDGRLRPVQDRILAASLAGQGMTMTAAEYAAVAVPTLEQTGTLLDVARTEASALALTQSARAQRLMALHLAFTLATLGFGGATLVVLRRRVLTPLRHLRHDLQRLARGDLTTPMTPPRHHDELGAMQAAISEFRNVLTERQSLWNALPDFICVKDGGGRWQSLNAAAATLFGVEDGACRDWSDTDLIAAAPHLESWLLAAAAGDEAAWRKGAAVSREEVVPCRSGEPRFFHVVRVPSSHADGSRRGMVILGRDVTDRRRAEAAIARLAQQNQLLLDCAGEGIVGLDPTGAITFVNPAVERLTGWDTVDLIGRSQHELMHHHHADGTPHAPEDCPIQQTLSDGQTRQHDNELFWRKDGSPLPVELTVTPISEQGCVRGAVIIFRDISARLETQREIDTLLEELKRSNAELERFAYVASHDLRQPLRMITSYLTLIVRRLSGRLGPEEQEFMDFAVDGAQRMDRMILDLLDYSRIGRTSEPTPVPLDEAMTGALSSLQAAIADSGAEITVTPGLPQVDGVRSELERLFQNLIANAIKFRAPDRSPKVTVTCRDGGGEWVVAVADNGIGIDPAQHDRLFTIFQRLVPQAQYEGTGIGLASCRKIAEHHGGRIWVQSAAGEGATFFVALPKPGTAAGRD